MATRSAQGRALKSAQGRALKALKASIRVPKPSIRVRIPVSCIWVRMMLQ